MRRRLKGPSRDRIRVSVIIPTFNGKGRLLLLLKSLEHQSVKDFEVVVVDDGSTDGTRGSVAKAKSHYPVPLRYYYLDNTDIFGAGIARNHGARKASGDVLLFIDQDCVAESDLIKKHIAHHETKDVVLGYYAGYGEGVRHYDLSELKDHVRHKRPMPVIKEFRDRLFTRASKEDTWKCFLSAHFSIKKEIFKKFYFDEAIIQWGGVDNDLGYRIFRSGKMIHFVKECVVYNSSEAPSCSKEKFLSLSKTLIYTYAKYRTPEVRLYCFDRFYNRPLKYRGSLRLIYKHGNLTVQKSQTKIIIAKNCHASITAGADFIDAARTVEQIIPLIKSIYFDFSKMGGLEGSGLLRFQKSLLRLKSALKAKNIPITLDGRGRW